MAFKSKPIIVGTTDTEVYVCPVGTEAAVVLGISNVTGGAVNYTLKFYSATLDETITLASAVSVAANSSGKYPIPLACEGGDEIHILASATDSIVAFATVTQGNQGPQFSGFTPKGDYVAGTTYAVNDYVSYDGTVYFSRVDGNIGNTPSESPTQWQVGPAKGDPGDLDATDIASASEVRSAAAGKIAGTDTVLEAMDWVTLTYGATPSPNHASGVNRKITLEGDPEFGAPTNAKVGWPLNLWIVQDAEGGRVPTWNAAYNFGDNDAPDLSPDPGAEDLLAFLCLEDGNYVFQGIKKNVKKAV